MGFESNKVGRNKKRNKGKGMEARVHRKDKEEDQRKKIIHQDTWWRRVHWIGNRGGSSAS